MTRGDWVYLPPQHEITLPVGLYFAMVLLWLCGLEGFWLGMMIGLCVAQTGNLLDQPLKRAISTFWQWATRS